MKKVFLVLTLFFGVLALSLTEVSAASSEPKVEIIEDTFEIRTARVEDPKTGEVVVSTFNKLLNTVTVTTYPEGEKGKGTSVVFDIAANEIIEKEVSLDTTTRGVVIEEKTISNYEYRITYGSPTEWRLRRPNPNGGTYYYDVYENSNIMSDLESFKSAVDDVNDLEIQASLYVGGAVLGTIVLYIITGGTAFGLQGLLGSLGIIGTAADKCVELFDRIDDAKYYYYKVRYAS